MVGETHHLDAQAKRNVDAKIIAPGISQMGARSAAACARKHAYEADREGYVRRGRTERKHRRVSLRPAPDTTGLCRPISSAAFSPIARDANGGAGFTPRRWVGQ